ncbi:MAG: hypothetical protein HYV07_18565 [Deltaproteobacteria bacterium]|nr:hypothetical protein [Deltaproteobacteria bacterium]
MPSPRLVALLLSLAAAGPASAQTPRRNDRLAVIPIVIGADQSDISISSVFNDVSATAANRLGLGVISFEELDSRRAVSDRVRDCGSDEKCIAERLRAFDARLGLVVVVNGALSPALLSINLIDTEELRSLGNATGQIAPEEGTVSTAIRTRAAKMFDQLDYILAARIVVDVDPPRALIMLGEGGEPDKGTPNVFTVAPGSYKVKASLDGYTAAEGSVEAESGKEARLRLVLDEQVSLMGSPWFWGAVGVAVVGGTTAAILATRKTTYCLCVKLGDSGCEQCRD